MKIVQHDFHKRDSDGIKKSKHCETVFKHFTQRLVNKYILGFQENHSHS